MSLSIRSKIERNYRDESQTAIENKGMGMPKQYYSYFPWLRTAPRSARLIISTLVSGIALGLGAAVVSLFVVSHAQKHPVTPIPIEATATASVPAPEKVEPANEARPSPSMGEATAMSASDDSQSKWSLQLIGDSSETRALAEYRNLQKRFPAILGSRTPVVIKRELGGRGSAFWYQLQLTEDSRERATALCMQLRSAGGECLVRQPPNVKAKLTFEPNDDVPDLTALKRLLGLSLTDMSIDLRKRYKIANWIEGIVVTDVNGSLPTIAKSLLPGDVVVEVAREPVTSSDDFWIKIDKLRKDGRKSAVLLIARGGGNLRFVPLSLTRP